MDEFEHEISEGVIAICKTDGIEVEDLEIYVDVMGRNINIIDSLCDTTLKVAAMDIIDAYINEQHDVMDQIKEEKIAKIFD